ncbi:MAG: hypothetical protein IJM19_04155 [Ruminococcus sp.]|nr:hypothetical protein [Ruminococcus sp.]MBR6385865.1 hypothetical protein [Ruminococcus sp.]
MNFIMTYAFTGTGAYAIAAENSPLTGDAGTTAALIAAVGAALIAIGAIKTKNQK